VKEELVLEEKRVSFASGDLKLEGLYAPPCGNPPGRVVVVCHPHPMYGGSMHNNVVEAILKGVWQAGHATLRFNFRGVGASEGEYDGGEGEVLDARAAVKFIASQPGVIADQIILGGYSFGAAMAMRAGLTDPAVARIVAVALPVGVMASGTAGGSNKPVLLVSGDSDSYSPEAQVRAVAASLGPLARVRIIAGADHFFAGFEDELTRAIAGAFD
jgi:alpha/beta superfamily hydrolase